MRKEKMILINSTVYKTLIALFAIFNTASALDFKEILNAVKERDTLFNAILHLKFPVKDGDLDFDFLHSIEFKRKNNDTVLVKIFPSCENTTRDGLTPMHFINPDIYDTVLSFYISDTIKKEMLAYSKLTFYCDTVKNAIRSSPDERLSRISKLSRNRLKSFPSFEKIKLFFGNDFPACTCTDNPCDCGYYPFCKCIFAGYVFQFRCSKGKPLELFDIKKHPDQRSYTDIFAGWDESWNREHRVR